MPPNIVYMHSHDTGRYVSPYGYAVPTPALQRLAEEGVLFRQAFCTNPTCSPSRASLLTGQVAHESGMLGLAHRGFALHDYGRHLVHTLRGAGYTGVLCGFQHIAQDPGVIGYDRVVQPASHHAADVTVAAAGLLGELKGLGGPFFLDVGVGETHRRGRGFRSPPMDHSREPDGRYCRPPAPLPDTPETRRDFAEYREAAAELDRGVGRVLAALDEHGLAEDTLVVCTTDHGIAFPGMKCSLTDHGTGVMLMVRGPGGFTGGKVVDAMVSQLDLFPTLCEAAGAAEPGWLRGKALQPLVRGEAERLHEAVFAEVNYHAAYEPKRSVRTERWKYIRRYDDRRGPVLPNCDDSPSKDVWLAAGWAEREPAREQLYDLVFDPNEACNLAGDARHAGVLEAMRGRLAAWMAETDDPLLKSDVVPAPPGAVANDPDGVSPREEPRPVGG